MNSLDWIKPSFSEAGFEVPPDLDDIIAKGLTEQPPYDFCTEEEFIGDSDEMNKMFPAHHVLAFGRREDFDNFVCLVLADGAYKRGSVLILHWGAFPGTEVYAEFPSLEAWAKSAKDDIANWDIDEGGAELP